MAFANFKWRQNYSLASHWLFLAFVLLMCTRGGDGMWRGMPVGSISWLRSLFGSFPEGHGTQVGKIPKEWICLWFLFFFSSSSSSEQESNSPSMPKQKIIEKLTEKHQGKKNFFGGSTKPDPYFYNRWQKKNYFGKPFFFASKSKITLSKWFPPSLVVTNLQ